MPKIKAMLFLHDAENAGAVVANIAKQFPSLDTATIAEEVRLDAL